MDKENKKIISIPFVLTSVFVIFGLLYFYVESSKVSQDSIEQTQDQIKFLEKAKKEAESRLSDKIKNIESVSDSSDIGDIEDELNIDINIDLSELDDLYEALNLGEFDI